MWNKILKEFSENPRDVHTIPKVKKNQCGFLYMRNTGISILKRREAMNRAVQYSIDCD